MRNNRKITRLQHLKRWFAIFVLMALPLLMLSAQRLVVYRISGNIDVVTPAGTHELGVREVLTPASVIHIQYASSVILFDEQSKKQYTFRTPGKSTVKAMMKDGNTTVITLTDRYLRYIKAQVFNKGAAQALAHNSDPATVTRDVDEALLDSLKQYGALPEFKQKASSMKASFDAFKVEARNKYDNFRRECAQKYADFARLAWEEVGIEPPVKAPKRKFKAPESVNDNSSELQSRQIEANPIVDAVPEIEQQPGLPEPVVENKLRGTDKLPVDFFGVQLSLRYPKLKAQKLHLEALSEDAIADVLDVLVQEDWDNLLVDCLEARKTLNLCDWAYYQLLKTVGNTLCPASDDCATVVTAFLYAESGYKMRMAILEGKIRLFATSRHIIYEHIRLTIEDETYIALEPFAAEGMAYVCAAGLYETEQPLSLRILHLPDFDASSMAQGDGVSIRRHESLRYPDISVAVQVHPALLDFYASYPASCLNDDFITRWTLLANAPLPKHVAQQISAELSPKLEGLSRKAAAERLLNLIQTGFDYRTDEEIWGKDRAFFAEESLSYPYTDCEDRSIIFSRLVRDLLGLKCMLVYYPNHLACAVCFEDEQVEGDYVEYQGQRYVIADPSYINARIGMTMPNKDNDAATVVVLE